MEKQIKAKIISKAKGEMFSLAGFKTSVDTNHNCVVMAQWQTKENPDTGAIWLFYVFICKYTHVPQYMDTLEELVLSFRHVVPRERKEVIMLGSKCLHLLDRLAGPLTDFWWRCESNWMKER